MQSAGRPRQLDDMRRFEPAGGGGAQPTSSSSSGQRGDHSGNQAAGAAAGGLPYGGGGGLSPGRGHDLHRTRMKDDGAGTLSRHSSPPAGFLSKSKLTVDQGFRGPRAGGGGAEAHRSSTGRARISEGTDAIRAAGHSGVEHAVTRSLSTGGSSGGFSILWPWDESRDIIGTHDHGGYESQFSGMGRPSSLELAGMDKYMQAQQQQEDHVAVKLRARRGCATHPRSVAERERRARISEKLRKLQDLVPNMDKMQQQTSTSDMLDLAVEHIKGLQSQLQAMKHERDKCTCCSKPN